LITPQKENLSENPSGVILQSSQYLFKISFLAELHFTGYA